MIDESKYRGCFKGLAIADAFGASYEGGIIERSLWRLIGKTREGKNRFTDDTQMSIDIAQSFLENLDINQDHLAKTFASSYKWSRGYGPTAAKLLKSIKYGKRWQDLNRKKFKEGSIGNGAAMRAPIVALCHPINDKVLENYIQKSAEITHTNPLAIEGAHIVAVTTCLALNDTPNEKILESLLVYCKSEIYTSKLGKCIAYIHSKNSISSKEIRRQLGNGIIATTSCLTSIYFGLKYRKSSFESMLSEIFSLGGDTDTIGAMAGGIWGAFNGDLEIGYLAKDVESIDLIEDLAVRLHKNYRSLSSNISGL